MHLVANFPAGYKWAVSYTLWRAYTRHALPFFSLSHNRNRTTITTPLVNDDQVSNHTSMHQSPECHGEHQERHGCSEKSWILFFRAITRPRCSEKNTSIVLVADQCLEQVVPCRVDVPI